MANLFNIGIDQIKHNGNEVVLMKLNGNIVYEKETFRIEYTVVDDNSIYINSTAYADDIDGKECRIGLPRIYTDDTTFSFDYSDVLITKKDGTIINYASGTCNNINKIALFYPEDIYGISFIYPDKPYSAVKEITYCNTSNFISMNYMFYGCRNLIAIRTNNWDTSNVTTMAYMFANCEKLAELNLSSFDTNSVTDMNHMFWYCRTLTSLDLSSFDTSNVTNMNHMFWNCWNMVEVDVSSFDTSNVTNMYNMFNGCWDLTSLDLSHFDTGNVTDMYGMFNGCKSLTSLNVSNFDISKISTMSYMFQGCEKLTELDLSSFDVGNVSYFTNTFAECSALTHFQAPKNINRTIAFGDCPNLTHDSLMSIINNLAIVTVNRTLGLGETNLAKLSEEEIAIATNKGWTVI